VYFVVVSRKSMMQPIIFLILIIVRLSEKITLSSTSLFPLDPWLCPLQTRVVEMWRGVVKGRWNPPWQVNTFRIEIPRNRRTNSRGYGVRTKLGSIINDRTSVWDTSTDIGGTQGLSVFSVRSTVRDSILLCVMKWGAVTVTLKSWSSWVWWWNSYVLSSSFRHVSRPKDFFFFPFSIVRNPKSRPRFSMSSEVSVGRLKTEVQEFTRLWDTGFLGELEHLKFEMWREESTVGFRKLNSCNWKKKVSFPMNLEE
jgi:hypothetical protein